MKLSCKFPSRSRYAPVGLPIALAESSARLCCSCTARTGLIEENQSGYSGREAKLKGSRRRGARSARKSSAGRR